MRHLIVKLLSLGERALSFEEKQIRDSPTKDFLTLIVRV